MNYSIKKVRTAHTVKTVRTACAAKTDRTALTLAVWLQRGCPQAPKGLSLERTAPNLWRPKRKAKDLHYLLNFRV